MECGVHFSPTLESGEEIAEVQAGYKAHISTLISQKQSEWK